MVFLSVARCGVWVPRSLALVVRTIDSGLTCISEEACPVAGEVGKCPQLPAHWSFWSGWRVARDHRLSVC